MKSAFYLFNVQSSSRSQNIDFFGHEGDRLNKKAEVAFKIMTSQTGKQLITIHL